MDDKQRFFDHHARSRSLVEFSPEEHARALALIESVELEPDHAVVEIGCGTGRLTELLVPRLPDGLLLAVDFAHGMLLRSRERRHPRNVTLVRADAAGLPLKDGTVDRALMFCVYPHLRDPRSSIREARRVLRPGGKLFVAHLQGSRALNEFHRRTGGAVMGDILPPAHRLSRLLDGEGLRVEVAIDEPERYLVVAAR